MTTLSLILLVNGAIIAALGLLMQRGDSRKARTVGIVQIVCGAIVIVCAILVNAREEAPDTETITVDQPTLPAQGDTQ